jgi:hypothetical protein
MFRIALYARCLSGPDARMSWKTTFAADGGIAVTHILTARGPVLAFKRAVADRDEDRGDRSMAQRVTLRTFDALASCFRGDSTADVRQLPASGQDAKPSRRRRR